MCLSERNAVSEYASGGIASKIQCKMSAVNLLSGIYANRPSHGLTKNPPAAGGRRIGWKFSVLCRIGRSGLLGLYAVAVFVEAELLRRAVGGGKCQLVDLGAILLLGLCLGDAGLAVDRRHGLHDGCREGVDIYVDELDYDLLDGCRVIVC